MTTPPPLGGTPEPDGRRILRLDSDPRADLRADCANCFGLCCVVPAFAASADFAIDKDAGRPCPNLRPDFGCGIHSRLRPEGFAGCTVYDCFGAGQKVAQLTFAGRDWRRHPAVAGQMFSVFPVVRQLQELLWYLVEALALVPAVAVHPQLRRAFDETARLTHGSPAALLDLDVQGQRRDVAALLRQASELARDEVRRREPGRPRPDHSGADLIGADLRDADLAGASLRGAYLIGADLRGADLILTDVIGADLRATRVDGADLSKAIFLTQFQLNAAKGDSRTKIPAALTRPEHWPRSTS